MDSYAQPISNRPLTPLRPALPTGQSHENDVAKVIITASPSLPKSMGALHPAGSLYEKPLNLSKATQHHEYFREVLTKFGAKVYTITEIMQLDVDWNLKERVALEDLASKCLKYRLENEDQGATKEIIKQYLKSPPMTSNPYDPTKMDGVYGSSMPSEDLSPVYAAAQKLDDLSLNASSSSAAIWGPEETPAVPPAATPPATTTSPNNSAKQPKKGPVMEKSNSKGLKPPSKKLGEKKTNEITDKQVDYYIGDEYKHMVLKEMTTAQLIDVILTNPVVTLQKSFRDTGLTASYTFQPLTNIVFCRDQQVTTRKGIIMAYLASEQRKKEVDVMEFCLKKLHLNVIGRIEDPGRLEGGDFIPAGPDLCFIGIGMRSNLYAVKQMMQQDLFGTRRVAVVKDEFEQSQDRMHLDTVFNIISDTCTLMLDEMMGEDSPTKRLVDEYVQDEPPSTAYRLVRSNLEFSKYVRDEGYRIIKVTGDEQLKYGCNGINVGNNRLVAVNKKVARKIARSKDFQGCVEYVDFAGITAMYGAAHCATQVVYRVDPSQSQSDHTKN